MTLRLRDDGAPTPRRDTGAEAISRAEARALMHAALDGEIPHDAPLLRRVLRSDASLRAEYQALRSIDQALKIPPRTPDITERVLAALPEVPSRHAWIGPAVGGLAASIAVGAIGTLVLLGLRPAPVSHGLEGGAPIALASSASTIEPMLAAPWVQEFPEQAAWYPGGAVTTAAASSGSAPGSDAAASPGGVSESPARSVTPSRVFVADASGVDGAAARPTDRGAMPSFQVARAGGVVHNPGPSRTPVAMAANDPMLGMLGGTGANIASGTTQRRDSVRFVVTGWYDSEGLLVPMSGREGGRRAQGAATGSRAIGETRR